MSHRIRQAFLIAAIAVTFQGQNLFAQELKIYLHNSMTSGVTIESLSDERAASGNLPTEFHMDPGSSFTLRIVSSTDPFSFKVLPDDEAGTVAPFRINLRRLAQYANGRIVELKGEFADIYDPTTASFNRERIAVVLLVDKRIVSRKLITSSNYDSAAPAP